MLPKAPTSSRRRLKQGFVLVSVLLIVALATVLVVVASMMAQLERRAAYNTAKVDQARANALFALDEPCPVILLWQWAPRFNQHPVFKGGFNGKQAPTFRHYIADGQPVLQDLYMTLVLGNGRTHRLTVAIIHDAESAGRFMEFHALLGTLRFQDEKVPETAENKVINLAPTVSKPVPEENVMQAPPVIGYFHLAVDMPAGVLFRRPTGIPHFLFTCHCHERCSRGSVEEKGDFQEAGSLRPCAITMPAIV